MWPCRVDVRVVGRGRGTQARTLDPALGSGKGNRSQFHALRHIRGRNDRGDTGEVGLQQSVCVAAAVDQGDVDVGHHVGGRIHHGAIADGQPPGPGKVAQLLLRVGIEKQRQTSALAQVPVEHLDLATGKRLLGAGHYHDGGVERYLGDLVHAQLTDLKQVVAQPAAGLLVLAENAAFAVAGHEQDDALAGAGHLQNGAGERALRLALNLRAVHRHLAKLTAKDDRPDRGAVRTHAVLAGQVGAQLRILAPHLQPIVVVAILLEQLEPEGVDGGDLRGVLHVRVRLGEKTHDLDLGIEFRKHFPGLRREGELLEAGKVEAVIHRGADEIGQDDGADSQRENHRLADPEYAAPTGEGRCARGANPTGRLRQRSRHRPRRLPRLQCRCQGGRSPIPRPRTGGQHRQERRPRSSSAPPRGFNRTHRHE